MDEWKRRLGETRKGKYAGENHPNYNSEEVLCDYCREPIKLKKSERKKCLPRNYSGY